MKLQKQSTQVTCGCGVSDRSHCERQRGREGVGERGRGREGHRGQELGEAAVRQGLAWKWWRCEDGILDSSWGEERKSGNRSRAICGPDLTCSCSVGVSRRKRTQEITPLGCRREASRMPEPRCQWKLVRGTVFAVANIVERTGRRALQFVF